PAHRGGRRRRRNYGRILIVGFTQELAPMPRLLHAPPLLEEERHPGRSTLVANRQYPLLVHPPRPRPALSPHDDPVNTLEINFTEIFEERLDRQKAHFRSRSSQLVDSR